MKKNSSVVEKAFIKAKKTRQQAHAPYSKFLVGCCLISADEKDFFPGCNVENASYGATVCAERNAIFSAVAHGEKEFSSIVLVTDAKAVAVPCALCLQVIAEFCEPNFQIHIANLNGIQETVQLKDLLPRPFKF